MTRREILILLLAHRDDALEAGSAGGRSDQRGSRLLMHNPDLWCEAFAELERCLTLMSGRGPHDEVRYTVRGGSNDGQLVACSRRAASWHMVRWYCPVAHRLQPVRRKARNGRRVTVLEPQPVRHPDAREDRAEAGLEWLLRTFDFRAAYPGLHWLAKQQRIPGLKVEAVAA